MEWWNDPRNPEFEGDEVGRPADEEPNQVGKEWQEMQTRLIKRLSRRDGENKQAEIPIVATHLIPAGHTFWFEPESTRDKTGWETKGPVYLRQLKRGRFRQSMFEVVAPKQTPIFRYGDFKEDYLTPGDIIYTSRVKKIKTRIKK